MGSFFHESIPVSWEDSQVFKHSVNADPLRSGLPSVGSLVSVMDLLAEKVEYPVQTVEYGPGRLTRCMVITCKTPEGELRPAVGTVVSVKIRLPRGGWVEFKEPVKRHIEDDQFVIEITNRGLCLL
jgi:hypothetical protein